MTSNNRPERSHILVAAKPTVTTDGFGSALPVAGHRQNRHCQIRQFRAERPVQSEQSVADRPNPDIHAAQIGATERPFANLARRVASR
jgi:hypothetical protein